MGEWPGCGTSFLKVWTSVLSEPVSEWSYFDGICPWSDRLVVESTLAGGLALVAGSIA